MVLPESELRWQRQRHSVAAPGLVRNSSLVLEKGDTFKIQGYYTTAAVDPRIYPMPAGPHLGVISFMLWRSRAGIRCATTSVWCASDRAPFRTAVHI